MARNIGGEVVQMSASYWPQDVARRLNHLFGFEHELLSMHPSEIEDFLKTKLDEVPLMQFVRSLPVKDVLEAETTQAALLGEDDV